MYNLKLRPRGVAPAVRTTSHLIAAWVLGCSGGPTHGIVRYYVAMRQVLGMTVIFAGLCGLTYAAPLAVHLYSTVPSPQLVGTPIGLAPRIENVSKGMHVFRYSVSVSGGPFRIVRDFSQQNDFAWTPDLYEHEATVRITVRNNETKETATDEARFQIGSRVKGKAAVVTPTAHPLIALFSGPPCPAGSQFRVAFRAEGETSVSRTSAQPCRTSLSNNVLVAGMRADTEYRLRSELTGGSTKQGEWLPFHTGFVEAGVAPATVRVPYAGGEPVTDPVLIFSAFSLSGGQRPFATDLQGRVVWYLPAGESLTRILPGGRLLLLAEGMNSVNSTREEQVLRERDLAGNIIRETNAGRVAEQLESHGIHSDCRAGGKECVSGLHHEAIRLPNGHTMIIAGLERMMPAGTQGSKEPVDVLGDLVIDLDEEFQVSAVWNEFDHLDVNRVSVFAAKCKTGQGGCPPVLLVPQANGWTHSNSLNYIASTGDFLISIPEQDWIVKVDWKNGKGSGKILWRLGKGGDFTAKTQDPSPWFSYAHDVGFEPAGSSILTLLDDGHDRHGKDPKAQSRMQVWQLDESAKTATLAYNPEIGGYSICCGSAQALKNGGYSSAAGWIDPASPHGLAVETDKNGKTVLAIEVQGIVAYRTFRVPDLYSAPVK
jgi:arylsulfate sulfotransferase